jgi:hypothetical protein
MIRDHREEIIGNSINLNIINKLLRVLCGYFLHCHKNSKERA